MECVERFKVWARLTVYVALPMLFKAMKHAEDIGNVGELWRRSFRKEVQPSV